MPALWLTIRRFVIPFALIVLLYGKIYHRVKTSGSRNLSRRYASEEKNVGKIDATSTVQHRQTNESFGETTNVDNRVVEVHHEKLPNHQPQSSRIISHLT